MATRSIVRIIDSGQKNLKKCDLYHHCDGYPKGVGAELLYNFFNSDCKLEYYTVINHLIKNLNCEYCNGCSYLGIEYIYVINVTDKTLKVYSCYEENKNKNVLKYNGETFYLLFDNWQKEMEAPDFRKNINEKFKYDYPELTFEEIQDLNVFQRGGEKYFVKFNIKRYELFNTLRQPHFSEAWIGPENTEKSFYQRTLTNKDYWKGKKDYEVCFDTFEEAKKYAETFKKPVKI